MSRSYRKHPSKSQGKGTWVRFAKREAVSSVRKYDDLVSGGMYKKVTDTWGIYDYIYNAYTRNNLRYLAADSYNFYTVELPCYKELQRLNWKALRK